MKGNYFIQQYMQQEYMHGGAGGTDAEKILLSKGFRPIYFPHHHNFSFVAKFKRFIFLVKIFFSINKGSAVVFLFPVYAKMNRLLLNLLSRKKHIHTICFIADIDGIKDANDKLLKKEIEFFRRFRNFIVHNEKMKEWVSNIVPATSNVVQIEFFDFLTTPVARQREISCDIVFAGNLEKSSFLKKLHLLHIDHSRMHFHLYGAGKTAAVADQPNATWHGIESPYELPRKLNGSFGLVWDGTSIDSPAGSYGIYMEYISHHKMSLYILSKLPVIAPATSAAALAIKRYKIGFTVNNLYEIEEKIKKLPANEYREMQINMRPLAERISKGQCLSDAIDEIMKQL